VCEWTIFFTWLDFRRPDRESPCHSDSPIYQLAVNKKKLISFKHINILKTLKPDNRNGQLRFTVKWIFGSTNLNIYTFTPSYVRLIRKFSFLHIRDNLFSFSRKFLYHACVITVKISWDFSFLQKLPRNFFAIARKIETCFFSFQPNSVSKTCRL
jgi:hypothetical protein